MKDGVINFSFNLDMSLQEIRLGMKYLGMLDEEGLEDYVGSFYGLKGRDYRVSCSCGEGFFQITVQHFEEEEPDLEEVVDSIFEILALEEDEWEFEYDSFENHSTVQSSERYEEVLL